MLAGSRRHVQAIAMTMANWISAIERARAHAPYLAQALDRQGELAAILASGDGERALAMAKAAGAGIGEVGVALRREKAALALVLAIGDLAGAFPLLRVTGELSALADRAMDAAIADAIRSRVPDAEPGGFVALALGKHGAGELNFSSDIDPILLYDPDLLPRRDRDEPGEAAQRVARTLVETMAGVTGDGYVFRIDLRLRPASEVSPLAIPIEAALTHYESLALAWERAAFIRARACAGDIVAGEAFLAAIRPFIWRKSLDFGAIAEIGRLTARIRTEKAGPEMVGPGYNLKLGRGGIREVEFHAQTLQLIHGGRNPSIRQRGVRATLDALAAAGLMSADDAAMLAQGYDRLRTIEHRLQMVADQQTHTLPVDRHALDNVARLDGLPDGAALIDELAGITEVVGLRYDALIAASAGAGGEPVPVSAPSGDTLVTELERLGFGDAEALAARIDGWTSGRIRALRSDAARLAWDAIRPQLLAALARAPEPDRAMLRWEALLANLPSGVNLFRLLEARPALLQLLARILSLAPPLAGELGRRADLLDSLIDASAFDLPPGVNELVARFADGEDGDDYQHTLDRVRRAVAELRFALGVQLIATDFAGGARDPLDIASALSRIAEAALRVLADAAASEFAGVHGRVPASELVIIGLGRFGGGVLTHASDLDLVYLFTGEHGAESDGARPLGATLYYNRLGQRVTAALSVPTAEGALYEVDTRLRPSGEQGPLAVSFAAFERYQREQAWTWEHMALTRARCLYGSKEARERLEEIIAGVLAEPRDPEKLRADVLDMRATMAAHKPPRGPLDVKLARGGLVDLEFLVHYLQLRDGRGLTPHLGDAVRLLAEAGQLDPGLCEAHDTMTRILVAVRLLAPDLDEPPLAARGVLARACGCADWQSLLAILESSRETVAAAWKQAFEQDLETA